MGEISFVPNVQATLVTLHLQLLSTILDQQILGIKLSVGTAIHPQRMLPPPSVTRVVAEATRSPSILQGRIKE